MSGQEKDVPKYMGEPVLLHPEEPSLFEAKWLRYFNQHVVGQEFAKNAIVHMLLGASSSWRSRKFPAKPAGAMLLLGPSGTGKNELVRALALGLCGGKDALLRIDSGNYSDAHNVSNIIGTTKGYLGYDHNPEITQWEIDKHGYLYEQHNPALVETYTNIQRHLSRVDRKLKKAQSFEKIEFEQQRVDLLKKKEKFDKECGYKPGTYRAIVLFDEAEKAHKTFYRLHYPMLDEAYLKLNSPPSDGINPVLLHNAIICYTANIAAEKISALMSGRANRYGYGIPTSSPNNSRDKNIYKAALKETREFFPPAFLRRLGVENILVCHPLTRDQLREILQRFNTEPFRQEVRFAYRCDLVITPEAIEYLLDESTDEVRREHGAGSLRKVFEYRVEHAILNLGSKKADNGGLAPGSVVEIALAEAGGKKHLAYLLHPDAWQGSVPREGPGSICTEGALIPRVFKKFDI